MDKTVLITGASGGIGYELARLFARDGYKLVLVARSGKKLEALKLLLEKNYHSKVLVVVQDLAEPDAAQKVQDTVCKAGWQVDALVNNAGFGDSGPYQSNRWEKQYQMVQVNILALMQLTRLFLPGMVERGHGRVLNIASIAAFAPGPYMAVYYASKAFVLSFSNALAAELKSSGVTVTAVCPGPTETGFAGAAGEGTSAMFQSMKVATAGDVARFAYTAMRRGKATAVPGVMNKLMALGSKLLPRGLVAAAVAKIQGPAR